MTECNELETIVITRIEYMELIRASEQLEIVKRFIREGYIGVEDLRKILNIKWGAENVSN